MGFSRVQLRPSSPSSFSSPPPYEHAYVHARGGSVHGERSGMPRACTIVAVLAWARVLFSALCASSSKDDCIWRLDSPLSRGEERGRRRRGRKLENLRVSIRQPFLVSCRYLLIPAGSFFPSKFIPICLRTFC